MVKRVVIIFLLLPALLKAQTHRNSGSENEVGKDTAIANTSMVRKNVLTAGVNYQNRLNYYGRTGNGNSKGLLPNIGFELKEGFYGNANFIFVSNNSSPLEYNGTVVQGGYKFPEAKHLNASLFYNQFLYKDKSALVQSAIKSQTGINMVYNTKLLNFNLGGDAKFSDRTDFGATAGLDHLFIYKLPGVGKAVAINPSAYAYAGTQNFSTTYINTKQQHILGLPVGQPVQQTSTDTKTKFNVLAYEFSAPVVLVFGKFNASFTPSYVIPQNLIQVPGRPELSETGEKLFYFSAGVGVRL